ncbi:helix-turn-helix transcriptional regulator [Nostoc sp. CHAB 5834]|nr:helix-turn-helix transcriptional regulator [Nostoc sp. CHAB 5834]
MQIYTAGAGNRVALVRAELNYSAISLARTLAPNASETTLRRHAKKILDIETGAVKPQPEFLSALAKLAGVNAQWLQTGAANFHRDSDIVDVPGVAQGIRAHRLAKAMSCSALSRASGLGDTAQNISRLENKTHRPRVSTLKRISDALRVSLKDLMPRG